MACLRILFCELLKEAGLIAGVTYRTHRLSYNQNGIAIAIFPYRTHLDAVA